LSAALSGVANGNVASRLLHTLKENDESESKDIPLFPDVVYTPYEEIPNDQNLLE
jgi:hypothetical protein